MTNDFKLDFDAPVGVVLDPICQIQSAIKREQDTWQQKYNKLAAEIMQLRNELAARRTLLAELPTQIATLTVRLQDKLDTLQNYLREATEEGFLLQL